MINPNFLRLRFACKLTFAILGALVLGFHFNLVTPRWSVMTAAIVSSSPAMAAGGEPFAGAIRFRGFLRIIGTFIGCIAAVLIVIATARAPVVMLLLCCIWTGVCTWWSSLVRVENSYALGLAGYTALIIVVTSANSPLQVPQFAVERCSEIVLGICCAIVADLLFSPRSIKKDVDRAVSALLLDQFSLMRICINQGDDKGELDKAWGNLVKSTTALNGMRGSLMRESSRWQRCNQRLKTLHNTSLTMITQSCETYLILQDSPERIMPELKALFHEPAETLSEVHWRMKQLRQNISVARSGDVLLTLSTWIGAYTRALLLVKGIHTNSSISSIERNLLSNQVAVKPASAEGHHAMINGLRNFVALSMGCLIWLWTGWSSSSSFVVMIAIVTSLAMRTPNPHRTAIDFVVGMLLALPIASLYFMLLMPASQQSLLLLCIALGIMTFIIGIEVQKRRLGMLGALTGTINVLVLNNPMTFNMAQFLDSVTGQAVGTALAMLVLLLIRDKSRERTGRTLLNRFMNSAVSALTTKAYLRRENHLPALYHQLNQLLVMFPNDIGKYRLALMMIIAHQRLKMAEIPVNAELSIFHKKIRNTADHVVSAGGESKRTYYYHRLLREMGDYQFKLVEYDAPMKVTEPVKRLTDMLHKYQRSFLE